MTQWIESKGGEEELLEYRRQKNTKSIDGFWTGMFPETEA